MNATISESAAKLATRMDGPGRWLVAITGPPASGKSTLAEAIVELLGRRAALVPMDGFHLDNRVLDARGTTIRKGAPETFDADGFVATVQRLRDGGEVVVPLFDRARDLAIAGASVIPNEADRVILEGNYLLFGEPPWSKLSALWDLSIRLDVGRETLRDRLIKRWRRHGLSPSEAERRTDGNDLANADRIAECALPADVFVDVSGAIRSA